jgi:hypothetical protein
MEGWWKVMHVNRRRVPLSATLVGLLTGVLLSGGCGSTGDNSQTLESLESRVVVIEQQSLPQASAEDARKSYKEVLESTNNQQLKARALERLTDLQLENQQTQEERAVENTSRPLNRKPA